MKLFYGSNYTLAQHAFDTTRKATWVADSLRHNARAEVSIELVAPTPLNETLLKKVHDPRYVEAIRSGEPRSLAESQDFSWDARLWNMVLTSNGGMVEAMREARRSGVAGTLSSELHHARHERGYGYCTFNGLALATQAALDEGAGRVLILDLDAHCGGGTASLIKEHGSRVHHLDISVDQFDQYEIPIGSIHTLDIVTKAKRYLPQLQKRLEELKGGHFDLCLYNAGMDPFEGCPEGGLAGMTAEILRQREQLVFRWCACHRLPVAFTIAGGYTGPSCSREQLMSLHRATIETAAYYQEQY